MTEASPGKAANIVNLDALLSGLVERDGFYCIEPGREWSQGRTLFGGMTAAMCLAAALRRFPNLPPLRTALIVFSGPAAGALVLSVILLRQGFNSSVIRVDLATSDAIAASAFFTFGAAKASHITHTLLSPPDVPSPDDCVPFFDPETRAPRFASNFDIRLAAGQRPISGAKDTTSSAWIRYLEPQQVDEAMALIALADALPPAVLAQYTGPSRISSMTWTIDLLGAGDSVGWKLLQSTSQWASAGYSSQSMTLWSEDGTPLAVGRQLIAMFE
jgi:acyl-CoA thioesterase